MRKITSHRVNPANDVLTIEVLDEPGSGGANHCYEISGFHTKGNASSAAGADPEDRLTVLFQNGPIA